MPTTPQLFALGAAAGVCATVVLVLVCLGGRAR